MSVSVSVCSEVVNPHNSIECLSACLPDATDSNFSKSVLRDSTEMTPLNFLSLKNIA